MMRKNKILVLEDEQSSRELVCTFLETKGFQTLAAENCVAGDRIWNERRPDAAVLDYSLPDGNALELLGRWKETSPGIPVIILTGHGSIDVAVQAIKLGAEQFLTKPADLSTLHLLLQRSLENERNRVNAAIEMQRQKRGRMEPFLGCSPAIRRLVELSRKLISTENPILIMGETGTGKGVLAHWIHENGSRAAEAFVDLNCSGLSRELVESELFGHDKGAFTGAVSTKTGLLEMAHRGTVFLDEIGDLDLQIQPRLLKVLEEQRFRRLGDVRDREVDVRLISATNLDLPRAVQERRFRHDLYFRISAIPLFTPPLRERIEDIPLLADWLLREMNHGFGETANQIAPAAVKALKGYAWPGNIRELRNVLERAVLLSEGKPITCSVLQFIDQEDVGRPVSRLPRTLEQVERDYIEEILFREHWRVEEAAKVLAIPRSSLYQKIKQMKLSRPQPVNPQSSSRTEASL